MRSIVYNQDCLEAMRAMDDKAFDLLVTDPPYFLPAAHYATRKTFKRNFGDLGILEGYFREWWTEVARVLKPTGSFYLFCDGQSYPLFYYYAYFFTKNVRPLIWDKVSAFSGFGWRHQHEIILWGEMPDARPINTGDGDIIRCPAVKVDERVHPAEKPVDIFRKLIEKSGNAGCSVLDPFLGSGSSRIAAYDLGFDFTGYELDKDYFEAQEKRFADHIAQAKLFDAPVLETVEQNNLF